MMTIRTPKSCLSRPLGTYKLVSLAPTKEPAAPTISSVTVRLKSH